MPRLTQERLQPLWAMPACKGMDNLTPDDTELAPGFVRAANNFWIDNEGMLHRRPGYSQALLSGSFHSGWSCEVGTFAVKDGDLVRLNLDGTYVPLLSGVGSDRMDYELIGQEVYFSNNSIVGYIYQDAAYSFPDPLDQDGNVQHGKSPMVGGSLITYYNGRLYAAQTNIILFSDANAPMVIDMRSNAIPMPGPITMLKAVKDGLWVSVGEKIIWIGGADPWEKMLSKVKVMLNHPAQFGSAVTFDGAIVNRKYGEIDRAILFTTSMGIFMGCANGRLQELTGEHYGVPGVVEGNAIMWHTQNFHQYVFTYQLETGLGGTSMNIVDPRDSVQEHAVDHGNDMNIINLTDMLNVTL